MDLADTDACYRALRSRDRRFDGVFYTGVTSTGIYCRPSCPALTPLRRHVTFHRTAAAAQAEGFRACKRCLPDATPGSPEWDVAADVAGRSMRLIADGVVEREGIEGLARRVGYTARHLNRILVHELGAGPLALARARRAQSARVLIETTSMSFSDAAFAAGFSSIRQFNDTVREVYAASPTTLRAARGEPTDPAATGPLELRLPVRLPFDWAALARFWVLHAVRGVEAVVEGWFVRTLDLPHAAGTVALLLDDDVADQGFVRCRIELVDLRDLGAAVERCRRMLDADSDPAPIAESLGADPVLGPLVARRPGLRVPGHPDGAEIAVRTVIGQQVSVSAARTVTGRLVDRFGAPGPIRRDGVPDRLFPDPARIAEADPETLPMPRARGRALVGLCAALAAGEIALDRGSDRDEVRRRMLDLPGIGPWTADYVAMRALGQPDAFLPTDLGVRNAWMALGGAADALGSASASWRPWRSYALLHLWTSLPVLDPDLPPPGGSSRPVRPSTRTTKEA